MPYRPSGRQSGTRSEYRRRTLLGRCPASTYSLEGKLVCHLALTHAMAPNLRQDSVRQEVRLCGGVLCHACQIVPCFPAFQRSASVSDQLAPYYICITHLSNDSACRGLCLADAATEVKRTGAGCAGPPQLFSDGETSEIRQVAGVPDAKHGNGGRSGAAELHDAGHADHGPLRRPDARRASLDAQAVSRERTVVEIEVAGH